MTSRVGSIVVAAILGMAVSSSAFAQTKGKRCMSPPAAAGAAWMEVKTDGKPTGAFYAQLNCPANYSPVSGGVRYEGAWNDHSIAFKWKEIASIPYDQSANPEATAWRCMVLRTSEAGPAERPDSLWCHTLCCRWD